MHIDINILQFLFILYFMGKLYVLMSAYILFVLVIKLPDKAIKGYNKLSCKKFFFFFFILQDSLSVPLFTVLF